MKRIYIYIGLLVIFTASMIFFWQTIPNITVATSTATVLQESSFPTVYIQLQNYTVNKISGYTTDLDSSIVRESITPLDSSKSFTIKIDQNSSKIKKLDYSLYDISNKKEILTNTQTAFESSNNYLTTPITLDTALDTSTEYGLEITLTTNLSKEIHFYTRIKYYEDDFYLSKKLDFVQDFHNATFGKKTMDISSYLEPSTNSDDNSTLADVTINSSSKMVNWNNLSPKQVTTAVPVIKEINIETAAIQMKYFITAKTDSATETYLVTEFYRLRYSGGHIYLLYFKRNMEALYDPDLTSVSSGEFKIGVTDSNNLDITNSKSNKKMGFVRNGSLWYYDLDKNKLTKVFSFELNDKDALNNDFTQHDIKIINVDNDGNMDFVVYGYMNSGDYEGRVAILLYSYDSEKNQITERVYIPLSTTYQRLKENFGKFCYVNDKNIFYFSLNDIAYAYNIASKKYEILSKKATSNNFAMLESAKSFVFTNSTSNSYADKITILNLNTGNSLDISADSGDMLRVLGTINSNIIYGYVHTDDIYESSTGDMVMPVYKLIISNCNGKILKAYSPKNIYITKVTTNDNIIHMKRVKKVSNSFKKISDDSMMNQRDTSVKTFSLTTRVTKKMLTEKYISLPSGTVLSSIPKTVSTKYVIVTENTTLRLDEDLTSEGYYIYAFGDILSKMDNAGDAIATADKQMGVVVNEAGTIVWERGGKFNSKTLSNYTKLHTSSTISSAKACATMLLNSAQITVSPSDLKGSTLMAMLKKKISSAVNLTGCTVDEILYFVSNEKPVIAQNADGSFCIITGYSLTTVNIYNPATGSTSTTSLTNAEATFKAAGYVFISYI